ncbi:MAG: LrgB family protein [Candidatus Heteroscillospira sp.]|jgi:predicted murein hydrolase (TIGR00659 family)
MIETLQNSAFFGLILTIACFELATAIKNRLKWPIFNPFLIATVLIIGVMLLLDMSYDQYSASAQHLSVLMTPATVCLAVPLYRKLPELRRNLAAVAGGIFSGVLMNMLVVFLLSRVFSLSHGEYVSMLPKSITTPIGIALCTEYGGINAITVLAILFTGIMGNVMGESLIKLLRIRHSVSRGLAIGTCAHAIGTAKAIELGETEGAISGLAIAVTGVITVAAAPFFTNLI